MKLADFLFQSGISTTELRRRLGVKHRSTITRWINGERIPNPHHTQQIIELSRGRVQLKDFLSGGNPVCATVIVMPNGRKKLVYPWSTSLRDLDAASEVEERRAKEQDNLSEPFREAIKEVADLVRRTPDGNWLLDGRPADFRRIVAEANRRRQARGEPPIEYPDARKS